MRIRIAVLVNDEGKWIAHGAAGDDDPVRTCLDCAEWDAEDHRERTYFVEAEVELPSVDEPKIIEGSAHA